VEAEIADLQTELSAGPPLAIRNSIEGELSMLRARAASLRQQIAAMGPLSFGMVDEELSAETAEEPVAVVEARTEAVPAESGQAELSAAGSAPATAARTAVRKAAKRAAAKKAAKRTLKRTVKKAVRKAAKKAAKATKKPSGTAARRAATRKAPTKKARASGSRKQGT
jgi:hypothetical protein